MSALQPLARLLAELLREDDRRVLLGEDVRSGGMLGLSRVALEDPQLRARLLGSPLTGIAHVAHAGGLALAGLRPIVLLSSAGALLEALAAMRELGRFGWRSGRQTVGREASPHGGRRPSTGEGHGREEDRHGLPVLFVAPNGPGFGLGGEAAESVEATLATIPGIEVWSAGRVEDLCGYLRSASDLEGTSGPRVLLLPRSVVIRDLLTDVDLAASLEREPTALLREGRDVTVFCWGEALLPTLAAADACARQEPPIEVGVVEVGKLAPLDESKLVELARATGKIVIVHAGSRGGGIAAELAALFADQAILQLDAPITRVSGSSFVGSPRQEPLVTGHDESRQSPTAAAIVEAILHVARY
jgi:pyruvate/2-oxoglutarate/acetoin dehydrogenase E1 component